ncbi:MAG TPA: alginate export family protein [Polyangiaceae bacterium]|nr:alginate export family protein [Polyangiaceae bacterium]
MPNWATRVVRTGVGALLVVNGWAARVSAQVAPPAPEMISIGDWQLAPVVEVRARGEYARGLDDQDWVFLTERARLGIDVQRGAVEGRVVMQDTRLFYVTGDAKPAWGLAPLALTGAYEAWVEAHTASARPAFVRVGRQPVTWGEGRLLGVADWSPMARSLDAVRGRLPVGDGAFELLAASLSDPSMALGSAYGELFGARGQWALHPLFAVEGYVLARLVEETPGPAIESSVRGQTYTGALRLHGDAHAWTWGVEGAYQLGWAQAVNGGENRAAWAAAGHVAHTFERVMLLPTVRIGLSYASGDQGGTTYRAFDSLLPDVHVWHGAMDLFAWSNEEEVSARVAIAPFTDAIAAVEYRYARLAQPGGAWLTAYLTPIGQAPGNTQADLGHEIDAVMTWSPWVSVELTAGYSALVLGGGARAVLMAAALGRATPGVSHLAYAQATLALP